MARALLTYIVENDVDDGHSQGSTWFDVSVIRVGRQDSPTLTHGGIRFVPSGTGVTQGETITATLGLYINSSNGTTNEYQVIVEDADHPPRYGPGDLPQNVNGVSASPITITDADMEPNDQFHEFDITDMVQEVVNRPGFTSSSSIRLALIAQDSVSLGDATNIAARNAGETVAAYLHIETGDAGDPLLQITDEGGTVIGDGATLTMDSGDFGTPIEETITYENVGTGTLTMDASNSVVISGTDAGEFSFLAGSFGDSDTLNDSGETDTGTLRCNATSPGEKKCTITYNYDDDLSVSINVVCNVTGTVDDASNPSLRLCLSGTPIADSSGNGVTVETEGSPTDTWDSGLGFRGKSFDGVDDGLKIPAAEAPVVGSSSFSWCKWINPDTVTEDGVILDFGPIQIWIDGADSKLKFSIEDEDATVTTIESAALSAGTTYYTSFVFDASDLSMKMYVRADGGGDGAFSPVASDTASGFPAPGSYDMYIATSAETATQ